MRYRIQDVVLPHHTAHNCLLCLPRPPDTDDSLQHDHHCHFLGEAGEYFDIVIGGVQVHYWQISQAMYGIGRMVLLYLREHIG